MSFFFSPTDCELYTANYAFGFYENPGHLFKGQQSKISECATFFCLFCLRHRAEFLGHMKPCESQSSGASGQESGNWTLVDEGGEEVSLLM